MYRTWEDHAEVILTQFENAALTKYEAGQKEHGGSLSRKPVLKHIEAEVVDLVIYFYTHKAQLKAIENAILKVDASIRTPLEQSILDMLVSGNFDGEEEEEKNPDTWGNEAKLWDEYTERVVDKAAQLVLPFGATWVEARPKLFQDIEAGMKLVGEDPWFFQECCEQPLVWCVYDSIKAGRMSLEEFYDTLYAAL